MCLESRDLARARVVRRPHPNRGARCVARARTLASQLAPRGDPRSARRDEASDVERAAPANPLTPRLVSSEAPTEQTQLCVRRRDGRNGVSPSSRLSAHHDTVYAAVSHDRRPTVVERATHARLLLLPPASFLACRLRLRRVSPAGIPRPGWSLRRQSPAQLVDDGPRLFQLAFEGVRAFLRRFQRHALVFQRLQRARVRSRSSSAHVRVALGRSTRSVSACARTCSASSSATARSRAAASSLARRSRAAAAASAATAALTAAYAAAAAAFSGRRRASSCAWAWA